MVNKAVLVGINYIGTNGELNGCINDVHNMKQLLIQQYKFKPKHITLLTDNSRIKPTRRNIVWQLYKLVTYARPGDKIFFHYSGHGSYMRDKNNDEKDGWDEAIVPLDYDKRGLIKDDQLGRILRRIKKGVKLTCLIDACYSGTSLDLRYNTKYNCYLTNKDANIDPNDENTYNYDDWSDEYVIDQNNNYPKLRGNVVMISGCLDDQVSWDTWEEGKACGAMSYSFIKTVKDNKGKLKYKHLIKNMNCLLKIKEYTQRPKMSSGQFLNLDLAFSVV